MSNDIQAVIANFSEAIQIATNSCEVISDEKQDNLCCHSEWHLCPKSPKSGFFASAQNGSQGKTVKQSTYHIMLNLFHKT